MIGNKKDFSRAFIETLQMVLTRPAEAFTAMKREGGFGEPLIYAVIGGSVGAIVSIPLFASFALSSAMCYGASEIRLGAMAGMGIGSIVLHYPCSTRHRHRLVYCAPALFISA